MDMGFTREHAMEALLNTSTMEQATEYLLTHPPPIMGGVVRVSWLSSCNFLGHWFGCCYVFSSVVFPSLVFPSINYLSFSDFCMPVFLFCDNTVLECNKQKLPISQPYKLLDFFCRRTLSIHSQESIEEMLF